MLKVGFLAALFIKGRALGFPLYSRADSQLPPLVKGEAESLPSPSRDRDGIGRRDLAGICRNLTKQLCSISHSLNVSRPGLGQGGFSNTARVYLDVTKKLYVVNQNEFHASVHGQKDSCIQTG